MTYHCFEAVILCALDQLLLRTPTSIRSDWHADSFAVWWWTCPTFEVALKLFVSCVWFVFTLFTDKYFRKIILSVLLVVAEFSCVQLVPWVDAVLMVCEPAIISLKWWFVTASKMQQFASLTCCYFSTRSQFRRSGTYLPSLYDGEYVPPAQYRLSSLYPVNHLLKLCIFRLILPAALKTLNMWYTTFW